MRELLKPKKVDNKKRRQRTASHQARVKQRNVSLLRQERYRQGTFRKAVVYPRTRNPSISSILVGTLTTLLWKESSFIKNIVPINIYGNMDEVLPAITFSVVSLIVVSLLTKKKTSK